MSDRELWEVHKGEIVKIAEEIKTTYLSIKEEVEKLILKKEAINSAIQTLKMLSGYDSQGANIEIFDEIANLDESIDNMGAAIDDLNSDEFLLESSCDDLITRVDSNFHL